MSSSLSFTSFYFSEHPLRCLYRFEREIAQVRGECMGLLIGTSSLTHPLGMPIRVHTHRPPLTTQENLQRNVSISHPLPSLGHRLINYSGAVLAVAARAASHASPAPNPRSSATLLTPAQSARRAVRNASLRAQSGEALDLRPFLWPSTLRVAGSPRPRRPHRARRRSPRLLKAQESRPDLRHGGTRTSPASPSP